MRNYLTIAGRDSRDFGVYISGQGTFSAPEKAYQFYEVPGRNGDIIGYDHRLLNIEVSYECFIYANFSQNIADFRTFLLSLNGYQKLADSYHPDEYRYAAYVGPFEPEVNKKNDAGTFTLTFNCKPQRYLISGDTTYSWIPGGAQTLVGSELQLYSPMIDESVLTWSYNKHGIWWSISAGDGVYEPDSDARVFRAEVDDVKLLINGSEVYSPTVTSGIMLGYTDVTVDFISGTGTARSGLVGLPLADDWSLYSANIFRAADSFIDSINECNWFKPVSSVADLSNYDHAICVSSGYVYIKSKNWSTLSSFKSWFTDNREYIQLDAHATTPQAMTLQAPYVPDYPSGFFKIEESGTSTFDSGYNRGVLTMQYAPSDSMSNPTQFPSEPMIRIYGTGSFEMDGVTITITDCTSYVDIDCELMDCYEGSTNRNNDVTFSTYDFPKLQPGDNAINIISGITAVEITPRWWRV